MMADQAAPAQGSVTHARILRIAAPIVVSNATVPILGVVDTGVVGQLGAAEPIGAVGLGAIILMAIYWLFAFLRMGTAGLVAQAAGAGDRDEVSALLGRALAFAGIAGLGLIAAQGLVIAGALALAPASDGVEALTAEYLAIRIWSAPAMIAIFGITGWLLARERTLAILVLQIGMNALNIVLDLIFVLGLGWGVAGVATATVIAEVTGLAIGLWFCRDALASPALRAIDRLGDRRRVARMAQVNGDILVRSLLLQAAFVSFLFLAADFGDVTLAANQVLLQFLYVTAYALDGFAFAAETLIGQAIGARGVRALRRSAVMAGLWGLATGAVLSVGFALIGPMVIDAMTTAQPVRDAARLYLPWMIATPILGAAAWMLDGIFIGATRTADMRNMMVVTTAIYAVALWLLLPPFGNHGLWAAMLILLVMRGATLALKYPALERDVG